MLVFIDDSGDPGFNFAKGSSKFFVIACIIFEDELEAEKTAVKIKELKRELKIPDHRELKFNSSNEVIREKFLRTINKSSFKIRCLVVNKSILRSKQLKENKGSFYAYIIRLALQHNDGSIMDAKVRIDRTGDRIFRQNFISYLRQQLNTNEKKIMKNCQLVDSKSNVLIQMADMVAASINRSYDVNKSDRNLYKDIIKKHIEDEWEFK